MFIHVEQKKLKKTLLHSIFHHRYAKIHNKNKPIFTLKHTYMRELSAHTFKFSNFKKGIFF